MPRPEKPRSIGDHKEKDMMEALQKIRGGMSVRKVSKLSGIPFTTLRRYHVKTKNYDSLETQRLVPNYEVNKVFDDEQEKILKDYYKHCSAIFYGLTQKDCRIVAFQMAEINNLKMPENWKEDRMAGKQWFRSYRRRHKDLSLRKPEPCSLARATAFNRVNVEKFFNNLENVLARDPAFKDGTRIFNLDETSTTTVQKPQRVLAPKGRRNVGKVTSGERGTLVTTCCIISASGAALPPIMVFPRNFFKRTMIKNTPTGTLGLASPSGWMNGDLFPEVMKHFIKHSNSTPQNPSLLIMDNHESHLSLEALNLAKAAGVHVLTLHPHTSGKLQPLDVGIYGPFKTYYNAAIDSWLFRNPGTPVTIFDVGESVGAAFLKVMTPNNIINAFKKCGIFPFDRNVFDEEDFLPSSVTDRPWCPDEDHHIITCPSSRPDLIVPTDEIVKASNRANRSPACDSDITDCEYENEQQIIPHRESSPSIMPESIIPDLHQPPRLVAENYDFPRSDAILDQSSKAGTEDSGPSQSAATLEQPPRRAEKNSCAPLRSIDNKKPIISPFEFRNQIKAGPRKSNRKPRKLGRSMIATDTPEKNEIALAKPSTSKQSEAKKRKIVKKVMQSDSDEEDEHTNVPYQESDEDNEWPNEDIENELIYLTEKDIKKPLSRPPKEGEYVLVEFATKKQKLYYIGKVLESRNENLEYYVSFLRKKRNNKYNMPTVPDLSSVKEQDIKFILPKPTVGGSTTRQQSYYCFSIDFSQLNVQ